MKVLVACEESGIVREAFKDKGHMAVSCDFEPTAIPGAHYQGDVLDLLQDDWDLIIAHPPCTFLCNSGVSWLHTDKSRWAKLRQAALFFKEFLLLNDVKVCVENPIMHHYGKELIGSTHTQIVHPYFFGHMEQKSTCLWLRNLPPLVATDNVKEAMLKLPVKTRQRLHYLPPGPERTKLRSRTFTGLASAMAEQWGSL